MIPTETKPSIAAIALKHILLATDFSQATPVALSYAAAVARWYRSKVYLAHVVASEMFPLMSPEAMTQAFRESNRYAKDQLARLSRQLDGIPNESLLADGEVIDALSAMIEKHDIDLVVVGTHGRRGIKRFLLGSVAEEIFRKSPCPVLTVGPHVRRASQQISLRHILYPTDLSEESLRAAPYACSLAREHSADIKVVHVLPRITAAYSGAKVLAKAFQDEMKRLFPTEEERSCPADFDVEWGEPVETILRLAKGGEADLIIMGARRPQPLGSHLTADIAYRVTASAECPVLTVHNSGDSD